jgi:hypothetical protein
LEHTEKHPRDPTVERRALVDLALVAPLVARPEDREIAPVDPEPPRT